MSTPTPNPTETGNGARDQENRAAQQGMTLVEIIVALGVLSVLATIMVPFGLCQMRKAHLASVMEDLMDARAQVELYEAELGVWPPDLETAYQGQKPPTTIVYCTDDDDPNSGHGNEFCSFFDEGNPSGNNNHGGAPYVGYILSTFDGVATCANVRLAWTSCCGREPDIVAVDEDFDMPGHPGNPQGNGQGNGRGGN